MPGTHQGLAIHRVSANSFELTGLRTGSIRDQILRAHLLVGAMETEGLIGRHLPLLVMGGGPAGVVAAMSAAQLGISATIIELEASPFATLRLANWRRVSPHEYDWPHDHWRERRFPRPGSPRLPLTFRVRTGAQLAQVWDRAFAKWLVNDNGQRHLGMVDVAYNTDARHFALGAEQGPGKPVSVTGPWPAGSAPRPYGAVLSCAGIGKERTFDDGRPERWSRFRGHAFWLQDDQLSTAAPPGFSSVLVSGGGDGAMQDFQRAVTSIFGEELFAAFERAARSCPTPFEFTDGLDLATIHAAEDRGRRAHAWRGKAGVENEMMAWQAAYERVVDGLARQWSAPQIQALIEVIRPEIRARTHVIHWLIPNRAPDYAYALNRFLSTLLIRLGRTASGGPLSIVTRMETSIAAMSPRQHGQGPMTHACGDPRVCAGQPHFVVLKGARNHSITAIVAELVIIRHGTMPRPILAHPPVPEHTAPYDVPH